MTRSNAAARPHLPKYRRVHPLDVPVGIQPPLFDSPETSTQWSPVEINNMRKEFLEEALRDALDNRLSAEEKAYAWQWIDSDEERPFSFRQCVEASCYDFDPGTNTWHRVANYNAERLREELHARAERLARKDFAP